MQMNTPMFHDAQRGCLLRLQSAQVLLDSSLTSALRVARLASVRSAPPAAGGRRDMLVECVCDEAQQTDSYRASFLVDKAP